MIIHGDCLETLKTLEDNSIDAVVTDPPYGLSFMGKKWDYDVPSTEIWEECLRVLKPGGYLLAFAGTRTQHRMAVRIEDAGFEIRDMIAWVYSTGFPKSLNVEKQLLKRYEGAKSNTEHNLRPLREGDLQKTKSVSEKQGEVLQSELSEQSVQVSGEATGDERREEPSLEGRSNLQKTQGKLQRCPVCEMPRGLYPDGEEGRIHNGAQVSDGSTPRQTLDQNRSSTSYRSQPKQQPYLKLDVICDECRAQEIRRFRGIGTALKPALEPITVARKPIQGTVAENCLKWGVGGINIDATRVENTGKSTLRPLGKSAYQKGGGIVNGGVAGNHEVESEFGGGHEGGRFPANLIHDGSDEVVELFPNTAPSKAGIRRNHNQGHEGWSKGTFRSGDLYSGHSDSGSASRFFYCAKASKKERNLGCEELEDVIKAQLAGADNDTPTEELDDVSARFRSKPVKNFHPTVKPIALMEYLVKLVSRDGATVLDPFAGSGTTGIACKNLNRQFIGIEREEDYVKIANARINAKV